MKNFIFFLLAISNNSYSYTVSNCQDIKDSLIKEMQSISVHANADITISGSVKSLGSKLSKYTTLYFGGSNIKIPYIGRSKVYVDLEPGYTKYDFESNLYAFSYFDASESRDFLLNFYDDNYLNEDISNNYVYQEHLIFEGFRHKLSDINCSDKSFDTYSKLASITAKSMFASKGSVALRTKDFDYSLVHINKTNNIVYVLILQGDKVLNLTAKLKNIEKAYDWIGINLN